MSWRNEHLYRPGTFSFSRPKPATEAAQTPDDGPAEDEGDREDVSEEDRDESDLDSDEDGDEGGDEGSDEDVDEGGDEDSDKDGDKGDDGDGDGDGDGGGGDADDDEHGVEGGQHWSVFRRNRCQYDLATITKSGRMPTHTRTTYRLTGNFQPPRAKMQFRRVICDECQAVRHGDSMTHIFILRVPKQRLLLVSATPTLNKIGDMRGLARLIASCAKLPLSPAFLANELPLVLEDGFDPFAQSEANVWKFDMTDSDRRRREEIKIWWDQDREARRFWYLASPVYRKCTGGDSRVAADVFSGLVGLLQTRRTMKTPLALPDGTKAFPGQGIPPSKIMMEEVEHGPELENVVSEAVDFLVRRLYKPPPEKETALKDKNTVKLPKDSDSVMNMAIHRILQMISFDFSLYAMFFDDKVAARDPTIQATIASVRGLVDDGDTAARPCYASQISVLKNAQRRSKGEAQPKLGVSHLKEVVSLDRDEGLSWKWTCLHDRGHLAPKDRMSMATWALSSSPTLSRAVDDIHKCIRDGLKTLVVVENPFCLQ